eukprot:NODE_28_length_38599_cov_0.791792.p18 type:complete len:119 gc:universal NODE_28_length_38599_cov_0.791792:16717-17073(+)
MHTPTPTILETNDLSKTLDCYYYSFIIHLKFLKNLIKLIYEFNRGDLSVLETVPEDYRELLIRCNGYLQCSECKMCGNIRSENLLRLWDAYCNDCKDRLVYFVPCSGILIYRAWKIEL